MGLKQVTGIRMKNGMDETITTKGTVSASGNFVVASQGRFNASMKWSPSKRKVGTDSRILMRLDISVSHYNGDTQGDYLLPYLSGRVVQIKGSFGSRTIVATPFDNETNRQYKNALISQDIWDAMKESIKEAIKNAMECAKLGKAPATAINSEYIENADEFMTLAESVAKQNTTVSDSTKAADAAPANSDIVDGILNGEDAGK